jgi:hypothetical protein
VAARPHQIRVVLSKEGAAAGRRALYFPRASGIVGHPINDGFASAIEESSI